MKHLSRKTHLVGNICLLLVVGMLTPSLVLAREIQERPGSLTLGAGPEVSPVYPGSDELQVSPFPYIEAEYTISSLALFIAGDEAGLKAHTPAFPGSNVSLGVKKGQSRNREDEAVQDILAGTADLENLVQGFAKLTWLSPVGQWSSAAYWLPTNAEYDAPASLTTHIMA
jgi:hypothetical protein